jgi:hypothetical protein
MANEVENTEVQQVPLPVEGDALVVTPMLAPAQTEDQVVQSMRTQAENQIDFMYGTTNVAGTFYPNQALIYSVKASLAYLYRNGIVSEPDTMLVQEAEIRGVPVDALVDAVIAQGRIEGERELARTRAKVALQTATTKREIINVMLDHNIPMANLGWSV